MLLSPEQVHLAEKCYGYGTWDAPYWFIGSEEGQSKSEDGITDRYQAFIDLQKDGLCDCRKFHKLIKGNELFVEDIHGNVPLQSTWSYQMELLYGYRGITCNPKVRRTFQANEWGSAEGKICIAELRGLPAYSNRERLDQTEYLDKRVIFLRDKIKEKSPEFVVFYGTKDEGYWNEITRAREELMLDGITNCGKTLFAYMPHPNAREHLKKKHSDWKRVGEKLCEQHKKV